MIDFRRRINANGPDKKVDPVEIYQSLDTTVDVAGLRVAQEAVLEDWFKNYRDERDIILKLHTGQGKTLVGLLMLQSQLNAGRGTAVYLCPNKYLVHQTKEQARKFGIKYCELDGNGVFPNEFLEGRQILITTAQRLFNGRTKFKLGPRAVEVGTIVLDDSHSCIDTIQDSFTIKISRTDDEQLYDAFLALFESDLKEQGQSRFFNVREGDHRTVMLIPYWAWQNKEGMVDALLRENTDINGVGFAWPLVMNELKDCQCYVSGSSIEISPYHNNIDLFGSFSRAKMRIFMSATTSNDAFFIKDLGIPREVVQHPLVYAAEKWSGEKMILDPYQMSDLLHRGNIIAAYAPASPNRKYGVVSLVHSHRSAKHWEEKGAVVVENVEEETDKLRNGDFKQTRVLVNRYDGIDLPDDACRILILDSLPFAQRLGDAYQEYCRPTSTTIETRVAQRIEQGLGRGVRGEKDYCVVIITGTDLINVMRTPRFRKSFSAQTQKQIEIGIEVNIMATQDATTGDPSVLLDNVIKQCLNRDEGWKDYYQVEMNKLTTGISDNPLFHIMELDRKAAEAHRKGDSVKAQRFIQELINKHLDRTDEEETGWYMQEMARYAYAEQRVDSGTFQTSAYRHNQALLRPADSTYFKKLIINQTQVENAKEWLASFASYDDCRITVDAMLGTLEFGKDTDKFESALKDLGLMLGFGSDQPDKQWKMGPDNLWNVAQGEYVFFECKSGVKLSRTEVSKAEAGQIGQHELWFQKNYHDATLLPIIITPARMIANNAALNPNVRIMDNSQLNKLKKNVRNYLKEFKKYALKDVTSNIVEAALRMHSLTKESIASYTEVPIPAATNPKV
ncbi:MAG TPA: DEAD/DEAH box helicase [Hymenobacter sp.]|uniref:DEAD/DEAH box helicase n=1 Tax=Hymenobacter sp. TaxID=1898978 RepID=UPI002D80B1CA|nr:DEAD/DEAH box helicase [Hymenobacter sp.]HET9504242.1 DEAD/DEAH box helicase [Hymenobacter sp.]